MNKKTIFDLQRIDPNDIKNSKAWFEQQIKLMASQRITPNRIMANGGMNLSVRLKPGRPVFFFYDPKFKETLPYFDMFPLVIPFQKTENGFMGLNLHYLDYKPRILLFKELDRIYSRGFDETRKLQYSWDLIRGVSKLKAAAPCIKQYLNSHVQSPFFEIPTESWYTAMMLPVQRFVGASKEQVWRESATKSRW
jgi:hypothetical protein